MERKENAWMEICRFKKNYEINPRFHAGVPDPSDKGWSKLAAFLTLVEFPLVQFQIRLFG